MKQEQLLLYYQSTQNEFFTELKDLILNTENADELDEDKTFELLKEINEWGVRIGMLRTLNLQE